MNQPRQRVNHPTFVRPARRQPGFAPLVGSGRRAQAQSFGLRAPSRPVRHARSFNGPVRRRRLRGQHREVPSVPAGARDEHTIEQEESGGVVCCDCPGVLLVASAAALLNHAAHLDRRALHTLQGPPRADRDTVWQRDRPGTGRPVGNSGESGSPQAIPRARKMSIRSNVRGSRRAEAG